MLNKNPSYAERETPLVVDLDGTLTLTDVFYEDAFAYMGSQLTGIFKVLWTFRKGKAALKELSAEQAYFDAALLPYHAGVIERIQQAKASGRPVYLATAANEKRASAIADHFGIFDGVFASSSTQNLEGSRKAQVLIDAFGKGGFDYVGNSQADVPIWKSCRRAVLVNTSTAVEGKVKRIGVPYEVEARSPRPSLKVWAKALRVHQYSKNALIFLPLLASHSFTLPALIHSLIAFVAFSCAASAIYLLNDLVDVFADRAHPSKRSRALAKGAINPQFSVLVSGTLLIAAMLISATLSWAYLGVLLLYIMMTTAYSLFIKRKLFIDIIMLALLYSVRVWAGGIAISVPLSNWLLTFCIFFFTTLALVKRYTELAMRLDANLDDPSNRNYRKEDLPVIGALGAASGMNAVTVFALYLASDAVTKLYANPGALWLACPVLLYLLARMLLMAQRRMIDDDPIVFVLKDRIWHMAAGILLVIFLVAVNG